MTSELEQEFFRVFGIEPEYTYIGHYPLTDENGIIQPPKYPEITAERLLEMICIYNSTYTNGYTNYSLLNERNVEKLKEQILKNCLIVRDDIKLQIQQLFKEEE